MGLLGISYIISHWPGSVGLHYRAMLSQNNTIFPSLCLSLWEWSMYFYFSEVLTLLTTATECHSPAALWSTWWRKTTTRKIFLARKNFFFLLFEQARKHCVWVGVNVQSQWECEVELNEIVTMSAKLSTLAWLTRLRLASIFSLTDLTEYQQRTTWLDSTRSLHGCKRYKSHMCGSCERKIRNQNRVKSEKFSFRLDQTSSFSHPTEDELCLLRWCVDFSSFQPCDRVVLWSKVQCSVSPLLIVCVSIACGVWKFCGKCAELL